MFPTKYPHRANFVSAEAYDAKSSKFSAGKRAFEALMETFEGGVYHLCVRHESWGPNASIVDLIAQAPCDCSPVRIGMDFELEFLDAAGRPFLRSSPGEAFGVCGSAWKFQFESDEHTLYYGMGEKNFNRLELSGRRTKFWNTDVWGDFPDCQWKDQPTDPPYLSLPYLILKSEGVYVGILLHTPAPAFMETAPGSIVVGAECGEPNLWVIHGPTLRALTRKLQKLVGVTPTPPLWSLGYHQSRWGYAGHDDLVNLDEQFDKHKIPCDALWLDIDYMHGYRVFTFDKAHFPKGPEAAVRAVAANRRKVVPILDPGVKRERGYSVYDDLKDRKLYCVNPEGEEFVGLVWPGETIFPDYTLDKARTWWAGYAQRFVHTGFGGTWLDMNDPSTGHVDPTAMLFQHGSAPHALHRNQYALGMQMATREGFLAANPNERPFLLSRSGSIGTSRFSAVWTGDNFSNRFYLKLAIPTSLNLSLSGIPFNGADVGGFGGSSDERLMTDWVKACFLFPFMRNHNAKDGRPQEPWTYSPEGLRIIRKFIRLRYKLLPYLYNLFCDQEEDGEPILRPLFYEFESDPRLDKVADQFLVGPHILQAPFLGLGSKRRIVLPRGENWFDACSGEWIDEGSIYAKNDPNTTPLYIRNGAILPLRPGIAQDNETDLRQIEFFVCARPGTAGKTEYRYRADDGHTLDYQRGKRSEVRVTVDWNGASLMVETQPTATGYGPIALRLLVSEGFTEVLINGEPRSLTLDNLELAGNSFRIIRPD